MPATSISTLIAEQNPATGKETALPAVSEAWAPLRWLLQIIRPTQAKRLFVVWSRNTRDDQTPVINRDVWATTPEEALAIFSATYPSHCRNGLVVCEA